MSVEEAKAHFMEGKIDVCIDTLLKLSHDNLSTFFKEKTVVNDPKIFHLAAEINSHGHSNLATYIHSNIIKLAVGGSKKVRIRSDHGLTSYLCPNNPVGEWWFEKAFFGTREYIDSEDRYRGGDVLQLTYDKEKNAHTITSHHGYDAELATFQPMVDVLQPWEWGIFAPESYLEKYHYGPFALSFSNQYFTLFPVANEPQDQFRFMIRTNDLAQNNVYLGVNGPVVSDHQWQWAYFGMEGYNLEGKYKGGDVFTFENVD